MKRARDLGLRVIDVGESATYGAQVRKASLECCCDDSGCHRRLGVEIYPSERSSQGSVAAEGTVLFSLDGRTISLQLTALAEMLEGVRT